MAETLRDLGVVVDHPAPNVYEVASGDVDWLFVPLEAAAKMRAWFILLGPLLARFGRVIISNPGGDRIGRRPVNLHVDAMRALGAEIEYRNGYYFARAPGRLRGTDVEFPLVSVMGTENAMLAAILADGHTTIRPAAQEPEVDDLIAFLQRWAPRSARTRPDTIEVDRAASACAGASTGSIPDRIEAGHLRRRGGGDRRPGDPRRRAVRPPRRLPRAARAGRRRRDLRRRHDRRHGRRSRPVPGGRRRDRALSRPGHRPPAADLRPADPGRGHAATSTRRSSRTASSSWPSCRGWAPGSEIQDAQPRHDHRHRPAARRRDRDRRPAGRRLDDPGRPGRRGDVADPRCSPRSPGV